jgi:hypothetical protein
MTPQETAERIVMDHLKQLGGFGGLIPKVSNMGLAKQLAHISVLKITEELRIHFQNCYEGIERLDYWKEVKRNINKAFEDKR